MRASVSSEPWPITITYSSTIGRSERIDASNGKPRLTPFLRKVKPLSFMIA